LDQKDRGFIALGISAVDMPQTIGRPPAADHPAASETVIGPTLGEGSGIA
jgi:hypothetical protein